MAIKDTCCTIVPYFKVKSENVAAFRQLCEQCVDTTAKEEGCLYYGFSFCGDHAHCREGYRNADALLTHLGNIDSLFQKVLSISELTRLEVHGPEEEIAKLRDPLAGLKPQFFVLQFGFRR